MIRGFAFAALMLGALPGCATVAPPAPAVEVTATCAAAPGFGSVCGPVAAEDLVEVPGGRWLLASGMNLGPGGHLYWIDRRSGRSFVAWPGGTAGAGHCGPAPGPELSATGLDIAGNRVLVVNGGGRKAIELFDIAGGTTDHPVLRWADCVPLPDDAGPNGITRMADSTLVATSFLEPDAADPWGTLERGAPLGRVLVKRAGGAWQTLDLGPLSGPNGLATGVDGTTLYVSEWGASRLLIVEGLHRVTRRIDLPFRPDNIHRLPDGKLLVAGQQGSPTAIGRCGAQCPLRWFVAEVDPATGAVQIVLDQPGTDLANYATAALRAGSKTFIAVRGENRVLVQDQSR